MAKYKAKVSFGASKVMASAGNIVEITDQVFANELIKLDLIEEVLAPPAPMAKKEDKHE